MPNACSVCTVLCRYSAQLPTCPAAEASYREILSLPMYPGLTDDDVVARVATDDGGAFAELMRRYNRRLYRTARAVTGDNGEAEDIDEDNHEPDAVEGLRAVVDLGIGHRFVANLVGSDDAGGELEVPAFVDGRVAAHRLVGTGAG